MHTQCTLSLSTSEQRTCKLDEGTFTEYNLFHMQINQQQQIQQQLIQNMLTYSQNDPQLMSKLLGLLQDKDTQQEAMESVCCIQLVSSITVNSGVKVPNNYKYPMNISIKTLSWIELTMGAEEPYE